MAAYPVRLGLIVAILALVADQAHKWWMLTGLDIGIRQPIRLAPFFDLVLVWNRGISYGLLSGTGRWLLVAIAALAAIALAYWLVRTTRPIPALSLGLIIGGAIGNGIDRVIYGAVADFFHFHIGSFSWYVFNLADIWIVAGVVGLLYDSIVYRPGNATNIGNSSSPEEPRE